MDEFVYRSRITAPARAVFAWHATPDALARLIPPGEPVRVLEPPASLRDGARAVLLVGYWPLRLRWIAEHRGYADRGDDGGEFTDVQVRGPFARWEHRHLVEASGEGACVLTDRVRYALPLGWLGRAVGGAFVRRKLGRMFAYRHAATAAAVGGRAETLGERGRGAAADGPGGT